MSVDKRTVTTDALETLGTVISENEKRDAIHLAVEPVIAGEDLLTGTHVGINPENGMAYSNAEKLVGIVDPFLKGGVNKGSRFWLVVYPRQINSLRHVWTHPDIPDVPEFVTRKQNSEKWIRDFLKSLDVSATDYDDRDTYSLVIQAALQSDKEDLHFGFDIYGTIPPEFWDHVEIVTGVRVRTEDRAKYFSCGC